MSWKPTTHKSVGGDIRRREMSRRDKKGRPITASKTKAEKTLNPYLLSFEKVPGWEKKPIVKKVEKTKESRQAPAKNDPGEAFLAASRNAKTVPKRERKRPVKKKNPVIDRQKLTPPSPEIDDRVDMDDDDPILLNEEELARVTGRSVANFARWLKKPWFPKQVYGGWRKSEVIKAVAENTRGPNKTKRRKRGESTPRIKPNVSALCELYELKVAIAAVLTQSSSAHSKAQGEIFDRIDALISAEKARIQGEE